MMKQFYIVLSLLFMSNMALQAQIIFQENFEGNGLPMGWTQQSNASDGGWKVGSASSLSSQGFDILSNGSNGVVGTNDDMCNCDKANEYLISPPIDLTGQNVVILTFDSYYTDQAYQGTQEDVTIEISTDGINWEVIDDLHGHGSWDKHTIDISEWAGEPTIQIGFKYDDNGGYLYGFAIDNVMIEIPPVLEVEFAEITRLSFGEVDKSQEISGVLFNAGSTVIKSMVVEYEVNGTDKQTENFENITIPAFKFYNFSLANQWTPTAEGDYEIKATVVSVNGGPDGDLMNNSASYNTFIYPSVVVPNKMSEFLVADPVIKEINGATPFLNKPSDLDFFPILGKNELWVVNQRTEAIGGSTVTIADATDETPSEFLSKVDGNSWHFMSLPTAIAFSTENFNFASSPGVRDANHNGGTFTGPSLWSSDLSIYAEPSGGNGSHLDMLHGSPFSMGITHEVDNVFWVYDDWNKDIVRYDFVDDHGPGNDDHSDAIVRRYRNIGINSIQDIPNHMIIDKPTGWLYFVDNGNQRVMRLDITSGEVTGGLPLINEPLAEHSNVGSFTVEEIINTGLDQPCGLEIFENYLMVGEYSTGDILVYDMDNDFAPLGSIATGNFGLTGIKMGPDGNIWFTNRSLNLLATASPGELSGTSELENEVNIAVSPNPTTGVVNIGINAKNAKSLSLQVMDAAGKIILAKNQVSHNDTFDFSIFPKGLYFLNFQADGFSTTRKLILN